MAGNPDIELIRKYFPGLESSKMEKYEKMYGLYEEWNNKVNLISRKDFGNFYLHHVLHSLALAKLPGTEKLKSIIDIGTGGGFPGLPLAVFFPETEFYLVDSIRKKINVVKEISDALALENVFAQWERAENIKNIKFDAVTGRAVTNLPAFLSMARQFLVPGKSKGIFYFKGGELEEEIKTKNKSFKLYPLKEIFREEFFDSKYIIHFPASREK